MSPVLLTAQAVADIVGGRLLGNGAVVLSSVGPLDRAGPDTLSFLVSPKYRSYFRASRAGAVLVSEGLSAEPDGPATRIVVPDPQKAMLRIVPVLYPEQAQTAGVDPTASIGVGVKLGEQVFVGPGAVVGEGAVLGARTRVGALAVIGAGVLVGDDCVIDAHAVCYPGARLGNRVVLKSGAVIAGPGFGYTPTAEGHTRLPHIGLCVLEDEVEIGSNTTIDRGSLDDTVIGRGSKIDNLVHIGHNVRMGPRCLVMGTAAIAGSARIGADIILAGGAGIGDHVHVGDRARLSARSVVFSNVPEGATMGGYPARGHRDFLRAQAALYRLPAIIDRLEDLAHERSDGAQKND
ncbi:MAG: UDP-3-O-(3-hydroxymyristoyl)glucosamine N-acyltransferase [Gemmatimonadota bacterium]